MSKNLIHGGSYTLEFKLNGVDMSATGAIYDAAVESFQYYRNGQHHVVTTVLLEHVGCKYTLETSAET